MKSLRSCISALKVMSRPVRWRMLVSVLIGLLRIAASLTFVWTGKALVDVATGDREGSLPWLIAFMVLVMLVQLLAGLGGSYWERLSTTICQNSLRYKYFSHVLRSSWNGKESFHSGDSINRLMEDVRVVTELLCSRIPDVLITICQFLAAGTYLIILSPGLFWVVLLVIVVAVFSSKMFYKKMRLLTKEIREGESGIHQHMQENLQNRVLALTLFGTDKVMSQMSQMQDTLVDNTVKRLNYNAVARGFMNGGFMLGYALAFAWGVVGIKNGSVTFGVMTAFLQLVGQVQRPVAELGSQVPAFIQAVTSIERLTELSDLPGEEEGDPLMLDGAPGIRFSNVKFAYPGQERLVFDGFSHDFTPGCFAVVMGPTGVGKSTLIRLSLALLKPSEGSVSIYGSDGKEIPASPLTRCNFTYVPQGNSLISGTIRQNLLLAAPDADEAKMMEALDTAMADFVKDLPQGLDTVCGESGSGLSEGQSQRIAIARALLHPSGVMILDEATSALDSETERRLLGKLYDGFHGKKTIVFISHREAVTSMADTVLRLS